MARKQSKKVSFFNQYKNYGLVALAVIAGVAIGLTILRYSSVSRQVAVGAVNQAITTGAASLKVVSVTEVPAKELFSGKRVDGEKGIVVDLEITNKTDATRPFLPVNQAFLKSKDGNIYQLRPVAGLKNPIKAGDLETGRPVRGQISFMVKEDSQDLWLYLDMRWDNSLPLVIALR